MSPEAEEQKKLGNECIKAEKYFEAMLHYSHAIKLAPSNASLYSNRALALLKVQQYYNGMQDALTAIKLMPNWEKGYFRLGEIQCAAEHYEQAIWSYKQALQIAQDDDKLKECIQNASKKLSEQKKADSRYSLYGFATGFLAALLIIIANEVVAKKSAIEVKVKSDILKLLLVAAISAIGYGLGLAYRYIIRSQRASNLDPPMDLLGDTGSTPKSDSTPTPAATSSSTSKTRHRQSKGNARQKMKTGKS